MTRYSVRPFLKFHEHLMPNYIGLIVVKMASLCSSSMRITWNAWTKYILYEISKYQNLYFNFHFFFSIQWGIIYVYFLYIWGIITTRRKLKMIIIIMIKSGTINYKLYWMVSPAGYATADLNVQVAIWQTLTDI